MPFETVQGFRNIDCFNVEDRFATLQSFENCKLVCVSLHELAEPLHHALTLAWMSARPHASFKCQSRLLDCQIDVLLAATSDLDENVPGRRVDRIEGPAADCRRRL